MSKPKVVILCGGRGSRLNEETEFKPKPLIEIGGKPILWHIMKIYAHYGFNEFVLCLGYKGEMIKDYFLRYDLISNDCTIELGTDKQPTLHTSDYLDWKVTCIDTGLDNLKGSRIKQIEKFIDTDYFFLTYGDGVGDINIDALLQFHLNHHKLATLTGVRPPSRFGDVIMDATGQVEKFTEKSQASAGLINGGFFVFNRQIFDRLSLDPNCDFEYGPLEKIAEEGELMLYEHSGQWECMDNTREMNHLNALWAKNEAYWKIW